jgi:cytoskeletal protein CcmA (bactofilin family)
MGIFSAPATATTPMVERRKNSMPLQGGLSIVAKDLTIAGDLHAAGVIRIEGRVIGNVHAGDQVLLTEGGIVEGDVLCREAVIGGRVHGSISGAERVELQTTAVVHGDIVTRRLLIQEGGEVNGAVKMEGVSIEEAERIAVEA